MERDVLATCPSDQKERWASAAARTVNGPRQRASAIRLKCLECCAWQQAEVRRCAIKECALWGLGGQAGG